eukprot:6188725-Pleurochrysis_carterae.AAC.1
MPLHAIRCLQGMAHNTMCSSRCFAECDSADQRPAAQEGGRARAKAAGCSATGSQRPETFLSKRHGLLTRLLYTQSVVYQIPEQVPLLAAPRLQSTRENALKESVTVWRCQAHSVQYVEPAIMRLCSFHEALRPIRLRATMHTLRSDQSLSFCIVCCNFQHEETQKLKGRCAEQSTYLAAT